MALIGLRPALDAAGVAPSARVVTAAPAAGDPALPALAVIPAIEGALANAHLEASDIDLWEVNEAFAVKVIGVMRHFEVAHARINVLGGAIAFGHPFAASGAILLVHMLTALEARGARRGLLALAGAGGVAEAMIIERIEVAP
jgi:acetyl-CoA C-acetyltransferase